MDARSPGAVGGREPYFDSAASWANDTHGALRSSRRTAWILAAVAVLVAALEAVALAALAPLKTVKPYVITVDRQTGYVQLASSLAPGTLRQDQAVTQSFLVQYVLARETFDPTDLSAGYHKVMLWSSGAARVSYDNLMRRTTPASPLNLYTAKTMVSVTIKSVSLLSPSTALVRFDTSREDSGSPSGPSQPWSAVIAFRYANLPLSMGDRFINPLGFQVTGYRRDGEAPVSPGGTP